MDGYPDIVVPSDVRFICAYDRNGVLLPVNPVFGSNKKWGLIGVWESYKTELKQENAGWGYPKTINDPREERYTANFARSGSVVADIDKDGANDILFSSYDGKIHCISLDKKEKNSWPFNVYDPQKETYEFASTPAVVDLDKDGYPEIVVSTWTEKESKYNGRLLVLNYKGELLHQITLPPSRGSKLTSGGLARPLIADIDKDNQYEAVLNTVYAGIAAYDLPGSKVQ